jgi:Zn-dependent protease
MTIDPATLVAVAIFLLVGFPVHEYSHALAAYRLGDGTAKMFGRLTLNPLVHLDPIGSLLLVVSAVGAGFFIGWAKPTPVNPSMLRGGRRAEAYVAAAGPVSNLLMAIAGAIVFRVLDAIVGPGAPGFVVFIGSVTLWFVFINVALFIFNLIPIPPLDGSKVMFALMNPRTAWQIRPTLEHYGFIILLVVMILPIGGSSVAGRIIMPIMATIVNGLVGADVLVGF